MKQFIILLMITFTLSAEPGCVRIGYGTVAPVHENKLKQHGVKTLGIIDIDPAKQMAAASKGLRCFNSYEEALQAEPSFWDICTPPAEHLNVIKEIIRLDPKARMIVEKPICMEHQIPELQTLLKTFQGSIVVNENYLSSQISEAVRKIAFESLQLTPRKIVIEMDKNRIVDFKKGRYIDSNGAFAYEGTHIVTILQSFLHSMQLTLPPKPLSVHYTDITSLNLPNQGSANIEYKIEGVAKLRFGAKSALFEQDPDSAQIAYSEPSMSICAETSPAQKSSNLASKATFATPSGQLYINLFSSMDGTIKNRYPPYALKTIEEHDTLTRYRVIAIEGLSPKGDAYRVLGFYEPVPDAPRSIGKIAVFMNGALDRLIEEIPDDSMGKHLSYASDYLLGKTNVNPCPPETGIEIVQLLETMLPSPKAK